MSEALKEIFKKQITKRNIILLVIALFVAGGVYYKYYYNTGVTTYEYAKVEKKDIKKTVEGSGSVVSQSELAIQQLQNGGKVTNVYVKPGDFVKQGQIIARLDSRQATIQVQQAQANYQKLINGATNEATDITKQNLINAQNSYDVIKKQQDLNVANAKRTLLNSSVTTIAQMDTRFIANNPTVSGSYLCDNENEYRIQMVTSELANVTDSNGNFYPINFSSVQQALGSCGLYLSFDVSKSYTNGDWKIYLPNKTASIYSTNLNSYNSTLQARDQALLNASTSIITAQLNLNQQIAPARSEDILASQASLASANLSYENTIVRAPFDGQIGNVSAIVGQQTNSQLGIATIITKTKLAQISLNEVDVINVRLGQNVELNFDAIPGEIFKGKIYQMDTVGVAVSNVVSFGVKISIKSGMSATANIIVESKENILTVPSGTIKQEGEKYFVMKKNTSPAQNILTPIPSPSERGEVQNSATSTEVASGTNRGKKIRSGGVGSIDAGVKVYVNVGMTNDIDTEILENADGNNLKEGDEIVSKTVNSTSATKPAATTFSLFGNQGRPAGGVGNARPAATTGR